MNFEAYLPTEAVPDTVYVRLNIESVYDSVNDENSFKKRFKLTNGSIIFKATYRGLPERRSTNDTKLKFSFTPEEFKDNLPVLEQFGYKSLPLARCFTYEANEDGTFVFYFFVPGVSEIRYNEGSYTFKTNKDLLRALESGILNEIFLVINLLEIEYDEPYENAPKDENSPKNFIVNEAFPLCLAFLPSEEIEYLRIG